jgi:hypothetical protein
MPIPVPVPTTPLPISDEDTRRAELLVEALVRVMRNGSSGTSLERPATPGITIPSRTDPSELVPFEAKTAEQQLTLRQTAIALVTTLVRLADANDIGVSRLSSDPSDLTVPTALNSEEVTTTPTGNLVPRARPDGTLDPAWVTGGVSGSSPVNDVFTGTCDEEVATGDAVYVSGPDKAVSRVDITDPTKIPVHGIVVSKPSATTCLVQTSGLVEGVVSGLTPNAPYFVSDEGRPSLVRPHGTNDDPIFVLPLGYAVDETTLLLRLSPFYRVRS